MCGARFLFPTILILLSSCSTSGRNEKSKTPKTFDVVGTWKLEKFTRVSQNGKETPWCKGAQGILTYLPDGSVSTSIDCTTGSPQESSLTKGASHLSYSGKYKFQDGTMIVHSVQNSSQPDLVGQKMKRHVASVSKKELIFTGKSANSRSSYRMEWKR